MENLTLRGLRYPFPPAISEHADEVHRGTAGWARRLGLLPDEEARQLFDVTGLGRLVARTHPDSSLEDLRLISDWYAWLFLHDDVRDEAEVGRRPGELSEVDARFLDLLEGAEPTEQDAPLAQALHDLSRRLRARLRQNGLSDVWMRRFVRVVEEHLDATLWEAANRARGTAPDLKTYVRMRPLTGGLSIVDELVEIVEGTHLPQEVRDQASVRRLTDASHNVTCWANDVLSLEKELRHGEVNNLVMVLRDAEGLGLQEAVDRAVAMHDAEVDAFVGLSGNLPVRAGRRRQARALCLVPRGPDEGGARLVLGDRALPRAGGVIPGYGRRPRQWGSEAMSDSAARASWGLENQYPCARSQPISATRRKPSSFSTPSATTPMPRPCAKVAMVWTISAFSARLVPSSIPWTNERSILRASTGKRCRSPKEE